MKTAELTGAALDWAVAKCVEGEKLPGYWTGAVERGNYNPSTDWSQGGPIIERERICTFFCSSDENGWACAPVWEAFYYIDETHYNGDTQLVTAMRCYVAGKLGDEVDVPESLM